MITEEQAREAAAFLQFKIADAYLDQLDRDAREADTPCPDCVILETDVVAVSVQSGLVKVGLYCADAYFNCRTVADLRRWCAALQVEMPKVGGAT